MNFKMEEAIEILERTPFVVEGLLAGLSAPWLEAREGEGTWSPREVVQHLIEAERTNWLPRVEFILKEGESKPFPPFDRFAHLQKKENETIGQVIEHFKSIRASSLTKLKTMVDPELHLELTGQHPQFGSVRLRELLSTWVVHDLSHLNQIIRVMAQRYSKDVGPWVDFLSILKTTNQKSI